MKTREDYVSNSSSCSFIIRSAKNADLSSIANDNKLLAALNVVPNVEIRAGEWTYDDSYESDDSKVFSDELVSECKESGAFKKVTKKKMTLKKSFEASSGMALLIDVLSQAEEVMLDFGLDDCGEYTAIANQVGMLFELAGFEVDDLCGETPYCSVKRWLKSAFEG